MKEKAIKKYSAVGAIILAAGKGTRFCGQKQFVELRGVPLWKIVYDKVCNVLDESHIVVVGVGLQGGKTRTDSVKNGLKGLSDVLERVIILEAARPLVTEKQIRLLAEDAYQSVSFVIPLVNTVIKRTGEYLNRNELYELLTPQAFDYKMLKDALASGQYTDMTDETKVMYDHYGLSPKLIETTENLIKVTYQRDIPIIERLMNTFEKQKETQ